MNRFNSLFALLPVALWLTGCSGSSSPATETPTTQTFGSFTTRIVGTAQTPVTVYSGSGAVTGISGASFTDVAATDRFNAPIVFTSDEDGDDEIWAMSATGTLLTQLTNDTGLDYQPSYSPDGTKIYFTSSRDYTGASVSYEIYSMTSTGASETRLAIDTETTQENASSMPLWQTRYIGTSGRLGTACAGFLFGRAGARVVANSPGDSSLSNLFFTLTTTVGLSSISYVNSFDTVSLFPAVVSVPAPSGTTGALIAYSGTGTSAGQVTSVLPYAANRGAGLKQTQSGDTLTVTGSFPAVFDAAGKNVAPSGAKIVRYNAKTGALLGFE